MKDFLDVNEVLYQKFLLDIYRHCDKLSLKVSVAEKEKMALEMVEFVGSVIKSLEKNKPILEIAKNDRKAFRKMSKFIAKQVREDSFASSVLKYYVSQKKIRNEDIDSCLATAAIAVMSKGRKADMRKLEPKIRSAKPYIFRVASLLSPAVMLHGKLFARSGKERIESDEFVLPDADRSFTRYIG